MSLRLPVALLALCLALSAHASVGGHPVAEAMDRAEDHNADNAFAKAVSLLEPFESQQRPDVDFLLAYSLYSGALNGLSERDAKLVDISRALALAARAAGTGDGRALNLL